MKTAELISRVASEAKITKAEARKVFTGMVKTIANALSRDETVTLPNFGSFSVRRERARAGRVGGGRIVEILPRVPVFKPSKVLIVKFLKEGPLDLYMENEKPVINRSEVEKIIDREIRRAYEIRKEYGLEPAPTPYFKEYIQEWRNLIYELLIKPRYIIKD